MKSVNSLKVITLSVVASIVLVGCGSDSSTTETPKVTTSSKSVAISGVAIDPELQGATVFLDINGNGQLDEGEPSTITDADGKYNLDIPQDQIGKPLVVEGGIDKVTKEEFLGKLTLITTDADGEQYITPLTTLVKEYKDQNPDLSLEDVKAELATKLGLADVADLDKDILKDTQLLKIALRVEKVSQKVAEIGEEKVEDVYARIAQSLKDKGFDDALDSVIENVSNKGSLDYEKIKDLNKELKLIDHFPLDYEEFALSVENIDDKIRGTKNIEDLDQDLYNEAEMIVEDSEEVKSEQVKRILEKLGIEDTDGSIKDELLNEDTIDFRNALFEDITKKVRDKESGMNQDQGQGEMNQDQGQGEMNQDQGQGEMNQDQGQGEMNQDQGQGEMNQDQGQGEMNQDQGQGEMNQDQGQGEMNQDQGQGEMNQDQGQGEMNQDQGQGEMNQDQGQGEMNQDQGQGEMNQDQGQGEMNQDQGQGEMNQDQGQGEMNQDQGQGEMNQDQGQGEMNQDQGQGEMNQDQGQGEMNQDQGQGEMNQDQGQGEMNQDQGQGEMNQDQGQGEMNQDQGQGEMNQDQGQGEMNQDQGQGEMNQDQGQGEMNQDQGQGEMNQDQGQGEMNQDQGQGEMNQDQGQGEMNQDQGQGEMNQDQGQGEMNQDQGQGEMNQDQGQGEMNQDQGQGEMNQDQGQGEMNQDQM